VERGEQKTNEKEAGRKVQSKGKNVNQLTDGHGREIQKGKRGLVEGLTSSGEKLMQYRGEIQGGTLKGGGHREITKSTTHNGLWVREDMGKKRGVPEKRSM